MIIGRFDSTTKRLKYWSTVPFTTPTTPDEQDSVFPDGTALPSFPERVRLSSSGGLEIDPTVPPPLNIPAFVQALKLQLGGIIVLITLSQKYPGVMLFLRAIEAQQWVDARAILDDALAKTAVTQAQHDGIISLAASYGITLA